MEGGLLVLFIEYPLVVYIFLIQNTSKTMWRLKNCHMSRQFNGGKEVFATNSATQMHMHLQKREVKPPLSIRHKH